MARRSLARLGLLDYLGRVFGGIVLGTSPVVEIVDGVRSRRLSVELGAAAAAGLELGASVAIDGTCLTVVGLQEGRVSFDVIDETLARTTLGGLLEGDRVNVERSLRVGDEVGGHQVSGHVMGTTTIAVRREQGENLALALTLPEHWTDYVFSKGFIAVDGCSLTVGEVSAEVLWLHLIPETRRRTTLGFKQVGDRVNVELDASTVAIVDTVRRVIERRFEGGQPA